MNVARSRWPARVHQRAEAERRFGRLGERLVPYLDVLDPLADDAAAALAAEGARRRSELIRTAVAGEGSSIPELQRLVESACQVPVWLDEDRLERAGVVFRRAGLLGGLTLSLCSLVHGYAAPAGNKPLAFSGRLTQRAARRLAETSRFVKAVTDPGGLSPFEPGFRICLMVRLMHAQVRRLLLANGGYRVDLWSPPINQHDMLATILLFSSVFVTGIRRLGVTVTPDEADDYQHLFRRVGELLGVDASLLPATFPEAERLAAFVHLTQGPPDADSRALVDALLQVPLEGAQTEADVRRARVAVRIARGLCRGLVGDELANQLGLPREPGRLWITGVRATVSVLERARLASPGLVAWVVKLGDNYWNRSVELGLGGEEARYDLPEQLAKRAL